MNIRYKLTTQNRTTHNGYELPETGVWFYPEILVSARSEVRPCSKTALHHYTHPLLAVLFNPIHANYTNPRLFEIEILEEAGTDGFKGWCGAQRILRELDLPVITLEQKVAFAIYCAEPYGDSNWKLWASNWMSGKDRSYAAAAIAAATTTYAITTYATNDAAAAAAAAAAATAATVATYAANAAANAANAAAYTVAYAATPPDFLSIIQRAMKVGG